MNADDYFARPGQSLITHVIGMIGAFKQIAPRIDAKYHVPLLEMITLHDAGKINPWFQKKLLPGNAITAEEEKLSYHVELSVIWLFLYYHLESNDGSLSPAQSSSIFAVMSHHLGWMKDATDLHLDLEKSEYLARRMKQSDIGAVLNLVKKVQAHVRHTFELSIFPNLDHVEDDITRYIQAMGDAKPGKILHFWGSIVNLMQEAIGRKIENPCLLPLLFSSILFDLDVWDARFYTPEYKTHAFPFEIDPVRVEPEMVSLFCNNNFGTPVVDPLDLPITKVRKVFRKAVGSLDSGDLDNLAGKILRLNAPTGSGKTINMLDVAIRLRDRIARTKGYHPRIIYCLPFVALGEQVASVAREVLQIGNQKFQSPAMMVHNYLAPVKFKRDEGENDGFINPADASWHVHTWQASIIITTFVQLLNTIFNAEKRYWTRAHVLAGSIILLDEVQTIPARYWDLISTSFSSLSTLTGTTIVFSTATQPAIFPPGEDSAIDLPTGLADENDIVSELDRYDIQWHPRIRDIDGLVELTCNHIRDVPRDDIMIVVNTTRVAKEIWQNLRSKATSGDIDVDTGLIYLLSGLVIPKHRKELLEDDICTMLENKTREKGIVLVCTQLIEAGVDVSFHTVYRDLAPLDSIVQVAGRCNRSGDISKGKLHVVNLMFDDNKTYADLVYNQDLVDLEKTRHFLDLHAHSTTLPEKELRRMFPEYYRSIREARETSTGVSSMTSCAYRTLKEEFHLIDTLSNMATLFIPIDNRSIQIRDILLNMSDDKFKTFPRGFYLYSINLNLKYLEEDAIAPLLPDEARNTFLLVDLSLYHKRGGLDIIL